MAYRVNIEKTGHIPWRTLLTQALNIRNFTLIFLILYISAISIALLTLLPGLAQRKSLGLDTSEAHRLQHSNFMPKMPHRNQSKSDGCHNNLRRIFQPGFQDVDRNIHLLSAYYDSRVEDRLFIHILALSGDHHPYRALYCLVNDASTHRLVAIETTTYGLRDNRGWSYGGYILTCEVTGLMLHNPCKVRVSFNTTLDPSALTLPTLALHRDPHTKSGFALCVPPLHGAIQQTKLVEFIELTRILGASRIFFYKYTGDGKIPYSNPNVDQVLDFYSTDDMVTVYPWQLPVPISDVQELVWNYAEAVAAQHCLFTNMLHFKYILLHGLDEFLIPREHATWSGLMEDLDPGDIRHNTSSYCFPMANFPLEVIQSIRSMSSTRRTRVGIGRQRVCMGRPERLLEMGSVPRPLPPYLVKDLPGSHGLVHWYQACDTVDCHDTEVDSTALRYKTVLVDNFRRAMLKLATS